MQTQHTCTNMHARTHTHTHAHTHGHTHNMDAHTRFRKHNCEIGRSEILCASQQYSPVDLL